jgi:CRP/FNR family transcriptional regulator
MEGFGSAQRGAGLIAVQGRSRASGNARRDHENARVTFLSLFWGGNPEGEELRRLYQLASKVDFCAGKTIFSEGERAASAFGLAQGYVRLYKNTPDGRRQIVAFALPGDFLGMPLTDCHSCSADAIDQVVLCRFPRAELASVIKTSPGTMRQLIDFATRELDMAWGLSVLLGHASAEERVTMFLFDWSNRLGAHCHYVPLPMLRQDIADFLGLRLETLSRALAKLEAKNVIRIVPKGVVLTGLHGTACF